jgi:hypothetical protein
MHSSLYFLVASLSLASAAPAVSNYQPRDVKSDIIDPWGVYGVKPQDSGSKRSIDIADLLKRQDPNNQQNTGDFKGLIPNCNDVDASTSTKNTEYSVDQGVKIPKNGKDDECTTGHNSDHCW